MLQLPQLLCGIPPQVPHKFVCVESMLFEPRLVLWGLFKLWLSRRRVLLAFFFLSTMTLRTVQPQRSPSA